MIFAALTLRSISFGQDLQNRSILKITSDLNQKWYGVAWGIGNARQIAPNNINLFAGVGYKHKSWWLESMAWRQWNNSGNLLALDFRFQKQWKKDRLYIEAAPFISRRGFYHFVIYEHRTWRKFNLGGETENILRPGRDSWGAGPRVSYPIGTIGRAKATLTLSYRTRLHEEDELRLYLIFNISARSRN